MTDIFGQVVPFTDVLLSEEECCRLILSGNQFEIRDVAVGEEPFEYSASTPEKPFYGPGYGLVKALVAQDRIFSPLVNQLALRITAITPPFQLVCGNVSGGMTPAFLLKLYLSYMYGRPVVYIYARDTRKRHGSPELLVGFGNNPDIQPGMHALDVEELVNSANTTCNAARTLRANGFVCGYAATLLDYRNPQAIQAREELGLTQVSLTTLPRLLDVVAQEGVFSIQAIVDYRRFLADPDQWQKDNTEAVARAIERKTREGGKS